MSEPAGDGEIDALFAGERFAGLVGLDLPGRAPRQWAVGLADRRWSVPMRSSTRAAIASGTKGFTALMVMRLIESGVLTLGTTARSLLGTDLPLIDEAVTIEHLLGHRSGIGDYLDEDAVESIADHVLTVPVHQLVGAEHYLALLGGHPQVSPPGEVFAYNNGGYVVLALLAERAAGRPHSDLLDQLVCRPARLTATSFVRSDALTDEMATGYIDADGLRTNALHVPLVGCGDGGLYSTLDDMARFWRALFAGDIVSTEAVRAMTAPRSTSPIGSYRYGLGFWLEPDGPVVLLEGYDAGISFRSLHDPTRGATLTVIGTWSEAAWPVVGALRPLLTEDAP